MTNCFSSNHGTKEGDTIQNKIKNKLVMKKEVLKKMMIYWWAWPQPLSGLESRILWIVPGPIVCLHQLISSLEDFSIIGKGHNSWLDSQAPRCQLLSGLESRILWIVPGPIVCHLQLILKQSFKNCDFWPEPMNESSSKSA